MTKAPQRQPTGLLGRAFHSVDPRGATEWQGVVISDLSGGFWLVQLFGWLAGEPTTQHVIHISEFASQHPNGQKQYRVFTSLDDANSYMEAYGKYRDREIFDAK